MTLKEIVKKWLMDRGYEGFGCQYCSCEVGDLMPCDNPQPDCEAGYKIPCPGPDECEVGGCDFHISPKNPKEPR